MKIWKRENIRRQNEGKTKSQSPDKHERLPTKFCYDYFLRRRKGLSIARKYILWTKYCGFNFCLQRMSLYDFVQNFISMSMTHNTISFSMQSPIHMVIPFAATLHLDFFFFWKFIQIYPARLNRPLLNIVEVKKLKNANCTIHDAHGGTRF